MVLQACKIAGVDIPRFCCHSRLSIARNCRMWFFVQAWDCADDVLGTFSFAGDDIPKGITGERKTKRKRRKGKAQRRERKRHYCARPPDLPVIMTTSRRLADRKVERFDKNITKRGAVPETTAKKGKDYPVGPVLLGFFIFVVIGSSLFQIIRTATSGGMA
ncbi:hypothetical protein SO802_012165 [Lithocarpus litseifolius]|uniref:Stress-associated endoplasmic reticulum protein n=1 Tax=Lithocarpus litseifolius TaxID=425828 RepID=A0AAW2D2R4_9ROSI